MVESKCPDWDTIVDSHGERVYRTAFRILGSVQDAEDVSQEVFVEAFRRHRDGSIRSWTGFLVRLTTRRAIDRLRRVRQTMELRENSRVSSTGPPDDAAASELADWLRGAIAELPDQQATIFSMTHFEGLSRDDIAGSLSVSPEAVSTALYKARQRLTSQLAVYNGGESQ